LGAKAVSRGTCVDDKGWFEVSAWIVVVASLVDVDNYTTEGRFSVTNSIDVAATINQVITCFSNKEVIATATIEGIIAS
jgi:hypothetical protein